jgi:hypothetical protein
LIYSWQAMNENRKNGRFGSKADLRCNRPCPLYTQ